MIAYINGAILEAIEKATMLKDKIPRAKDLGLFFSPLATLATNEIDSIVSDLEYLYEDVDYSNFENIRQKFSRFKQISGRLSEIENVVIAAISRKTQDDEFVNKLVYGICSEVNYPIQTPVASCLSQKYYHIYPYYNLICIPLLEADFLLHIADIFHELGHPLISVENPRLKAFKTNLGLFNNEVKQYFDNEIKRRDLNKMGQLDQYNPLYIWRDSWIENWSTELFCDLFATYTLGPAYAWSNIHMCAKMSWDIYKVSIVQKTFHPPNDARMQTILLALNKLDFKDDAKHISEKWEEFKHIVGQKKSADYEIAIPEEILQQAVNYAFKATEEVGCTIVYPDSKSKFFTLLNDAWKQFWMAPEKFILWEKRAGY